MSIDSTHPETAMFRIFITTLLFVHLALGSADACECDRTSDFFLNWIDERTHIYRAKLISVQDTIEVYPFWSRIFITFQVIDLVFGKNVRRYAQGT